MDFRIKALARDDHGGARRVADAEHSGDALIQLVEWHQLDLAARQVRRRYGAGRRARLTVPRDTLGGAGR